MVFPRHEAFGAESGFRNFGLWRSSGNSGEVDPVESGAVGGSKQCSDVVERTEIVEKKGGFQGWWGENARRSRATARTGNRLQTEPQGFKYFSHVFGNFFGHRGFDDDEKVSNLPMNGLPFPFDSELRSRFGVRRDFQGKPFFAIRSFHRNFGSKKEIQKGNRFANRYVRRFFGSIGPVVGRGTSERFIAPARGAEKVGKIERLEIRVPRTPRSSGEISKQIFEPRCRKARRPSKSMGTRDSKRVVLLPFFRIRKHFVGG